MLPVLSKIGTIFEYIYDDKGRPTGQTIDRIAINPINYTVTAKFDGTCCYIKDGKIHPRQDIKKNISNAPEGWFPTAGIEPDKGGHIIGFRNMDTKKTKKGDKWHLMALDKEDNSKARFLEYNSKKKTYYYITKSINEFNGKTVDHMLMEININ